MLTVQATHSSTRGCLASRTAVLAVGGLLTGALLHAAQPRTTGPVAPLPVPVVPPSMPQPQPIPRLNINGPFLMVTLGDSVMWGQGIPDGSKYRDLVAAWLQFQFGGSRQVLQVPTHAHSGAHVFIDGTDPDVETGLWGEIPSPRPSIALQIDLTTRDMKAAGVDPRAVSLVLLNGGANDAGILNFAFPPSSTDLVRQLADTNCVGRLTSLLPKLLNDAFPNAAVVITGYYPVASPQSDLAALIGLGAALGADFGGPIGAVVSGATSGVLKDQIVANSAMWNNECFAGLTHALAGNPRVALAWPNFQDSNAYATSQRWLWLAGEFTGDEASGMAGTAPQAANTPNGVAWQRARACVAAGRTDGPLCWDASMGHPNLLGAQAYAAAIINMLHRNLWSQIGLPPENPACVGLRNQEGYLQGQISTDNAQIAAIGQQQQSCEAGTDPHLGPAAKPAQCGAKENQVARQALQPSIASFGAQLQAVERNKAAAACWY